MALLRAPGGCPWDIEQTHHTLCRYLIEETAELLDTIDRNDWEHMREELGDVLLQVYFHAQIAEENQLFDLEDVAAEINEKLIRRHPHVFGDMDLADSEAVLRQWEKIKTAEKTASGKALTTKVLKDLPPRLPALLFAADICKQVQKKKLAWPTGVHAELTVEKTADDGSALTEEEAGRQLFLLAAACQKKGIDPESACRRYAAQIEQEIENAHAQS